MSHHVKTTLCHDITTYDIQLSYKLCVSMSEHVSRNHLLFTLEQE